MVSCLDKGWCSNTNYYFSSRVYSPFHSSLKLKAWFRMVSELYYIEYRYCLLLLAVSFGCPFRFVLSIQAILLFRADLGLVETEVNAPIVRKMARIIF